MVRMPFKRLAALTLLGTTVFAPSARVTDPVSPLMWGENRA
jgi:hypothetical protein